MRDNVKQLKTQSLLQEMIQEALCSLDDERLNSLGVVGVQCSKGKYSAKVFLDTTFVPKDERQAVLRALNKANFLIRDYLKTSLSWYRIPLLSYEFDENFESANRLDSIFKQISKGEK